jgi:hypothetical protein
MMNNANFIALVVCFIQGLFLADISHTKIALKLDSTILAENEEQKNESLSKDFHPESDFIIQTNKEAPGGPEKIKIKVSHKINEKPLKRKQNPVKVEEFLMPRTRSRTVANLEKEAI